MTGCEVITQGSRQGGEGGGGPDPPTHSAPKGGYPPLVGKENKKYFSYFANISVKIGHFKH